MAEGALNMTGSNLPPGVTESMIPGNRPEDLAAEEMTECLYDIVESYLLQMRSGAKWWQDEIRESEHVESIVEAMATIIEEKENRAMQDALANNEYTCGGAWIEYSQKHILNRNRLMSENWLKICQLAFDAGWKAARGGKL